VQFRVLGGQWEHEQHEVIHSIWESTAYGGLQLRRDDYNDHDYVHYHRIKYDELDDHQEHEFLHGIL
jgi:hypothetical protein